MANPMFSIIVVSLNAGEKLTETIESIRKQSFTDYEVVVKDGGSKDGSVDELRAKMSEYDTGMQSRIRIVEEKDSSIYDGMNQAVAKTCGKYLYFLNCGDNFHDGEVLAKVAEYIEKDGAAAKLYYGDVYDVLRESIVPSNPKIDEFACYRYIPCHQACIYDRELFRERGYEPKYRVRADYEHFLYCFFAEKVRPLYIPVTLASYEGGGFSETAENKKRSAAEHKEITAMYMSPFQRFKYRAILILTLQPLRTKIAENPKLSGCYNKMKNKLYRRG